MVFRNRAGGDGLGKKTFSKIKLSEILTKYRFPIGIMLGLILISGYFYFYNQFWTHLDPATFKNLSEYSGSRIRGHRGRQILVHREFSKIMNQLNHYAVKNNLHILITHSIRPPDTTVYDAIVAPAVKSNHLAGHAVDFNMVYGGKVFESGDILDGKFQKLPDSVKGFVFDIQADPDIRWGGDFETADPVHLDDGLNINDPEKWKRHYDQCVIDYIAADPKWKSRLNRMLKGLKVRLQ